MFGGGDYDEVARWLRNFVASHAKRENLRVEAVLEAGRAREGKSYGIRLRLQDELRPAADLAPLELGFAEVAAGRGSLAWCDALAERVRARVREFSPPSVGARRPA
jgi:hypothetical protein